jgi:GT2 family glycosyltransferase/glycosyltransferase involved in cell wall biosynthesis
LSHPIDASIIILTYNNLDLTRLCLESIFRNTNSHGLEIIIVDNHSGDGTPDYLRELSDQHPNVVLILNEENQGFSRGNNQGAARASGKTLVFLNNDTLVTPGWLPGLNRYLDDPQVGMVGPVTNFSGNEGKIAVDYLPTENLKVGDKEHRSETFRISSAAIEAFAERNSRENAGKAFEIRMLPFFCTAIRRSVFQEIGPLDEDFGIGMFEDEDYAERLSRRGYRILCIEDVFVHHWGSASFSRLGFTDYWLLFEENLKKFELKWGETWQPQLSRSELQRQQMRMYVDGMIWTAHALSDQKQEVENLSSRNADLYGQVLEWQAKAGELTKQLDALQLGKAWRIARFIQTTRLRYLPPGSLSEKIAFFPFRLVEKLSAYLSDQKRRVSQSKATQQIKRALTRLIPTPILRWLSAARQEFPFVDRSTVTLYADPQICPGYQPRRNLTESFAATVLRPLSRQSQHIQFTLIATVRNEATSATSWLNSLMQQSRKPDEIIITDGGSRDDTLSILEEFARSFPIPIKVISAPGANISRGRNIAIENASFPVIASSDFGSILDQDWLKNLIQPFEVDEQINVSCGYYEGAQADDIDRLSSSLFIPEFSKLKPQSFMPSSRSIAFRKDIWVKAGGYPEWLTDAGEDTYFDYLIKRQPTQWAFVPQAKVYWQAPRSFYNLYKTVFRYARGDGESGLMASMYHGKIRILLRSLAGLGFMTILVAAAIFLFYPWGYYLLLALLFLAFIRLLTGLRSISARFGVGVGLAARYFTMHRATHLAHIHGFLLGVSNRPKVVLRQAQYYRPMLQEIISQHPERQGIVIYPATHDWGFMFQRPQQMARAFARRRFLYFYCTANEKTDTVAGFQEVEPYLYLCHVPLETFTGLSLPEEIERPILYLGSAWHHKVISLFKRPRIIYDHYDDLAVSSARKEDHQRLLLKAEIVLTSSQHLHESVQAVRPDALLTPNGVDYSFIQSARPARVNFARDDQAAPTDWLTVAQRNQPVVGYSGAMAEWFDYDLLRYLAKARPGLEFVLIGVSYDGSLERSSVLSLPNVHWLGMKLYSQLFQYVWRFEIGIIPFKINQVTLATSPIKQFEYMACRKPVVTTALPECLRYPEIFVADSYEQFAAHIDKALGMKYDPEYLKAIDRIAQENTWDQRVEKIITQMT